MYCPLGVDSESFQPLVNISKEDFVVSVGVMSPRKGFDFLVESLGQIPSWQRPSLKLACNMVAEDELRFVRYLAKHKNVDLEVLTSLDTVELRRLYNLELGYLYKPLLWSRLAWSP